MRFRPSNAWTVGDVDYDGSVNLHDVRKLVSHWLESDCGGCVGTDLTSDGRVDLEDFARLGAHWKAGQ